MTTLVKFNSFVEALAEGKHDFGSDTIRAVLTNSAPDVANTVLSDIVEIASTTNGYTGGGHAITVTSSAQTGGVYKLVLADLTITQSGVNAIGPWRYVVFYNDSAPSNELIGYADYGSNVTLAAASGSTITIDFDASAGALTVT